MESWWDEFWGIVKEEAFSFPGMGELTRVSIRLAVAAIVGGIIGYEREARGKAAGLRTHMLVAVGAAVFVIVPIEAGMDLADLSRVIQGVVTGVGFLGAGAIMKLDAGHIKGLTTAASIWLTAAIGIACGMGYGLTALVSAVFALLILAVVRKFLERP